MNIFYKLNFIKILYETWKYMQNKNETIIVNNDIFTLE